MAETKRPWHGYPGGFLDWLRANVALLPLIALCGAVALSVADSRYMVREEDGEKLETKVAELQRSVDEIRTEQRVSKGELGALRESVQEVKEETKEVNRKLDRLIERTTVPR